MTVQRVVRAKFSYNNHEGVPSNWNRQISFSNLESLGEQVPEIRPLGASNDFSKDEVRSKLNFPPGF